MYKCIYIRMCIYMYIYICIYTYIYMYTSKHLYTYIFMFIHLNICIHIFSFCIYMYTYTWQDIIQFMFRTGDWSEQSQPAQLHCRRQHDRRYHGHQSVCPKSVCVWERIYIHTHTHIYIYVCIYICIHILHPATRTCFVFSFPDSVYGVFFLWGQVRWASFHRCRLFATFTVVLSATEHLAGWDIISWFTFIHIHTYIHIYTYIYICVYIYLYFYRGIKRDCLDLCGNISSKYVCIDM